MRLGIRKKRRDSDVPQFRGGGIEVLEQVVDRFGIIQTVSMLSTIANDRAEKYVGGRMQLDPKWSKAEVALNALIGKLIGFGIPTRPSKSGP